VRTPSRALAAGTFLDRYVAWLDRRWLAVVATTAVVLAASVYLVTFHLPLRADLANLLPQDVGAVRDLRRLEARLPAKDTMLAVIVAPDPATREATAADAIARMRAVSPDLIERLDTDDADTRAFLRAHRGIYVPLEDLEKAQRALAKQIALHANPLYLQLDDDAPDPELEQLRAKRREAEARLDQPALVRGNMQVIVIKTAFRATDTVRDQRLQDELDAIGAKVRAAHPSAQLAFTGGVPQAVAEHGALVHGMLLSSLVTGALVVLVLLVHLRRVRVLALLTINIVAATVIAFGIAAVTVGHLNAATAFLGAIIAGNGINYGILLVARFLEERRAADAITAMAAAISGTLRPTLVASLGAAIAYGALAVTRFKGFGDFALIGGVGMLVCWVASFSLLPALILRFARSSQAKGSPLFGGLVVRVFGFRRPAVALALGGIIVLAAGAVTARYIADDPFEYDMAKLRSDAPDALELHRWMQRVNDTFGNGLAGMSGTSYIAVDDAADVPLVVAALHGKHDPMLGQISSILDLIPPDQAAKLAVLAKLRDQIDEAGDSAPPDVADLRPPDDLRAFTPADLPAEVRVKLTERDGRIGNLIAVKPSSTFDEWNGHDLIAFANAVRNIELPGGKHITSSGPAVVFADIITTIRHDGPVVTLVAAAALVGMVLLVVGRNRRALAVLAGTASGSLVMVAICALADIKINFLDFVALPIALGLGIDYAINVADRADRDDPLTALRSTGGTVLVCSLTTMIGYASLLVSSNLAIRGFGLASLIGEITCVVAALTIVPAIVRYGSCKGRDRRIAAWSPGSNP
jgi:predicted RND superfamily exporter protein